MWAKGLPRTRSGGYHCAGVRRGGVMKPVEVSLSWGERRRLKRIARRIYNRLIIESPRFNRDADQVQNIVLGLGGLVVIGALSAGLGPLAARAAEFLRDSGRCPAMLLEAADYIAANPWVPAIVIALTLIVFFMGGISAAFFERSGDSLIWLRKFFGSRRSKNELLEIVETWLRRQPEKVCDAHDLLFKKPPEALLPNKLTEHLVSHAGENVGPPAMIIRHFAEKKYWWLYVSSWFSTPADDTYGADPKYFRNARGFRNAIRINLVFDVLGAELRDDIPAGNNWRRNYITGNENQYTSLFDPYDIHLRFRSSAAHYRWPDASRPSSEREMATFRVVMALENPMRAPIFLISTSDIVNAFPDAVAQLYADSAGDDDTSNAQRQTRVAEAIDILQRRDVPMYGKRDRTSLRTTAEGGTVPEPVLKNLNRWREDEIGESVEPDWAIRWDPNIIDWSTIVDPGGEIFRSLAILVRAIEIAGSRATPVNLGRGDVMVLDNQRCLVARREWNNVHPWIKQVVNFPERWWLRGHYGFRKSVKAPDILGS